jgi:hypothetical protein
MELRLKSDLEMRLKEHAAQSGYTPEELVLGLVEGYLDEVTEVSLMLDLRLNEFDRKEAKLVEGDDAYKSRRKEALERSERFDL